MTSQTVPQLLAACPDETTRTKLDTIARSWRQAAGSAADLLSGVRGVVADSSAASWREAWLAFEDAARRDCAVLTPYELSRVFGLEEQFERSTYEARRSLAQRLRLDCDFLETERRAKEEEARLARMSARERAQHDSEVFQRQQYELMIQQQMMQGQQDSWVQAQQTQMRAGSPRRMLDGATLQQLREAARSRGIDVSSSYALTVEAHDVDEAIEFARLFSHDRGCDLFRGQPADWNPIPSVLRVPMAKRTGVRWHRFREWALAQAPLAAIAKDQKKLAAVAQHYGLPTYLLDWSRNPRVAAFFATHTDLPAADGAACIFCLNSGALDASYHHVPSFMRFYEIAPQMERVDVDGLFRMQAQEGSFVYANQEQWTSVFSLDVIRFPRTRPVSSPLPGDLYPATKSEIEVLIDEYFANEPDDVKRAGS